MTMETAILPSGFRAPPGLEFQCPRDDNTMLPVQQIPLASWGALGTRLSSKAIPFQPRFNAFGVDPLVTGYEPSTPSSDEQDTQFDASVQHLQQTLVQLKGSLAEWEPSILEGHEHDVQQLLTPTSDHQDTQFDASVQNLQETLVQLKGSLAEWQPSMPKDVQDDSSVQQLKQTLSQLKGALKGWKPSVSKSDDQDDCSTQSGSSKSSIKTCSTKSSSTKGSARSKADTKSSRSKCNSSKSSGKKVQFDASVTATADVAVKAAKQVMDTYAYQPNHDLTPTILWGAQSLPVWANDPQQFWQCGWQSAVAGNWIDHMSSMPVSIADCLKNDSRDKTYDLKKIDPSFILRVRKIFRLGLESGSWLKAYFSKYGVVDKVLVGNSRSKASSPGCVGFVVMSTTADVQAILRAGEEHVINGVCVTVQQYKRTEEDGSKDAPPAAEMVFQ